MTINEITEQLNNDMLNFSRSMSGDGELAKDLVQDVMVKAIEREHLFSSMNQHQVKAWLFRAIKNLYIDNYRRSKRHVQFDQSTLTVEDFQDQRVLKLCLSILTREERKIINMKYFGGYSSKEIAEHLQMNPSTVRNRVATGIEKLRIAYREES